MKMSNQESDFGSFLIGFFVGALLGAAAGMLFAPQSGEETREQIHQKSIELSEQATHKAEEARAKAEHLLADARQ
jgi:gas vesicle protein